MSPVDEDRRAAHSPHPHPTLPPHTHTHTPSLRQKDDKMLDSSRCWSLFLQMCLGLYDIHQQKVLHRDMKTANVFLSANESDAGPRYFVKIGDLGVAKLLGTSTAFANTVVGTPYYLSPELCEDKVSLAVRVPSLEKHRDRLLTHWVPNPYHSLTTTRATCGP